MPEPVVAETVDIAPDAFRRVMGHFVTGVTVVTTLADGDPQGITVNALSSVSLEPPLVMVALDRRRFITPAVRLTGRYAVNVLSEDQQALSDCFAGAPVEPGRDAFCGATWTPGATGCRSSTVRSRRSNARSSRRSRRATTSCSSVASTRWRTSSPIPMPLLYYRRQYLRIQRAETSPLEGVPEHSEP